ncbi:MAG: sensor histidine kinase, partial [Bacteroidota bacterium]
ANTAWAMLKSYLQLETLRFKEKLHYQLEVDDRIDQEITRLPSMVLQPFIENAIWHGLMPKNGDGLIKISIQEEEGVLKCVIEDNGVGREQALSLTKSKVLKKKSLGLQITEDRLKLLSKERLKELIRITDLKDSMNRALGTRVDVLIPITQA